MLLKIGTAELQRTGTAEPRFVQALYNEGYLLHKILTDGVNENKISIPLNIYSYFAVFKNNVHPNIKMSILIRLASDNDFIFHLAAAPDSKVLITKFRILCPKLIFNGLGMVMYIENYLKPKTRKSCRLHLKAHFSEYLLELEGHTCVFVGSNRCIVQQPRK